MRPPRSTEAATRLCLLTVCAVALAPGWGCGGTSEGPGSATGGTQASSTAGSSAGATPTNAAGSSSTGGTGAGGAPTGGAPTGGVSSGGSPACSFQTPQCPSTHSACAELGTVQDCFYWQTCHSAPGQMVCCDSGWEMGRQCSGAGGAAGAAGAAGAGGGSADACGGCDTSSLEICVFQSGGPGAGHYACAKQNPCGAAGLCACIVDQGTCSYEASGDPASCVCDNGLD